MKRELTSRKPLGNYEYTTCPCCGHDIYILDNTYHEIVKIRNSKKYLVIAFIVFAVGIAILAIASASPSSPIGINWENKTIFIKMDITHHITVDQDTWTNLDKVIQRAKFSQNP